MNGSIAQIYSAEPQDGCVAMRGYLIACSPSTSNVIEPAIERLADSDVSPFIRDIPAVGDAI
jgi:hypothetical protein